jgi:hypothetical protein
MLFMAVFVINSYFPQSLFTGTHTYVVCLSTCGLIEITSIIFLKFNFLDMTSVSTMKANFISQNLKCI